MLGTETAGVPLMRKSPSVPGPRLIPRKKTSARSVYLEPSVWEELDEAAEFHEAVFKALDPDSDEKVSRNEVIAAFLRWSLDEFWADKGGRPTSKAERAEKAKRHAEATKRNAQK